MGYTVILNKPCPGREWSWGVYRFFALFYSTQSKIRRVEQAQRFHQQANKEQQIASVLTSADKKNQSPATTTHRQTASQDKC